MDYRGFGAPQAQLTVYIENTPPLEQYQHLHHTESLTYQDILNINSQAGNGWRKVFNVYAKFLFELCPELADNNKTWQQFRESSLLQFNANHNLLMSLDANSFHQRLVNSNAIRIITGKGYAERLGIATRCHWLTPYFAVDEAKHIIVCPYFDYRQLTNERITALCKLVRSLNTKYLALQRD